MGMVATIDGEAQKPAAAAKSPDTKIQKTIIIARVHFQTGFISSILLYRRLSRAAIKRREKARPSRDKIQPSAENAFV
jgi:hypothetical protein